MPKYRITTPDGSTYEVTAPEGASQDEVLAYAQEHHATAAPAGQPAPKPAANDSDFARMIAGKKKEDSSSVRGLKLGARDTISGVTDILGIVGNPLNYLASKVTGRPYETMTDAAGRLMDSAGLPRPETPQERVVSDVGRTLSGTAVTMGAGSVAPAASRVNQFLTSNPYLQIVGGITGAGAAGEVRENGGGAGAQTLAALAGGLSPAVAKTTASGLTRLAARGGEAGRQAMERGIYDFRLNGTEPSVGQATGNRRMQGLESLLAGGPTSGGVMSRAAEKQAEALGQGLQSRANGFYPNASAERAGRAVERGVDTFTDSIKGTRNRLYSEADKLIPDAVALPLTKTRAALLELTTPNPSAKATTQAMINPKISALAQNIEKDLAAGNAGLPYSTVKDIRSRIGAELSDFSLSTDKPTAEYKRLYAALSQDMEDAARKQGPAATQAARRASDYFKASADRLDQLQRVVDKNGGPEKIYNAVMSGTKDGGTTLHAVMQSLPPEGQKAMTGAVLKRMGLATPGNQGVQGDKFSAQTFLTNWNGVSKEAKRALFDRHGPRFVSDMDRIARVAERITTGSKVFANPSGTTNRAAALTYGGSLVGTLASGQVPAFFALAASGAGANITARMMTSPKFVSWLARTTELPASALNSQLVILQQIAKSENDEDMKAFAEASKH